MQHSAETIRQLSKMQYDTFQIWRKIAQVACGAILIYLGLAMSSSLIIAAICMLFGCLLFTGTDMPARHRADKVIKALDGKYPRTDYIFRDRSFEICADSHETIPYASLIHLGEDKGYLYLYISRTSAYMIDKSSIEDLAAVKEAVCRETGMSWQGPRTLSYYSIFSIIRRRLAR